MSEYENEKVLRVMEKQLGDILDEALERHSATIVNKVSMEHHVIPIEWIRNYQMRHIGQWEAISIDCMIEEWLDLQK